MTEQTNLPGRRLRDERLRRHLTEQDVAGRLHLSVSYVRALEADDYRRLPEPAFVKGYMRNYARLLELPADELVAQFQQHVLTEREEERLISPVHMMVRSERGPVWLWPTVILGVALIVGLAWWGTRTMGRPVLPEMAAPVAQPVPAEEPGLPEPINMEAPSAPLPENLELAPPAESAQALDEGAVESTVAEAPQMDRLHVTFDAECWVEVRDAAGEPLFQGQQRAGSQLALEGEAPFRVTLGNAAAVTAMQFNGEAMSLPTAAPGRVIRVTVP